MSIAPARPCRRSPGPLTGPAGIPGAALPWGPTAARRALPGAPRHGLQSRPVASRPSRPAAPAAPQETADLRRGFERGREVHGDHGLPLGDYCRGVREGLRRRRNARHLPADEATVAALVPTLALADLYLVRACDAGSESAWRALVAAYAPRLAALVRAREGRSVDPDAVVTEVFSGLALPPREGGARTCLGTFDGSGSLWSWLAATLVHRLLRAGRDRLRPVGDEPLERGQAPEAPADGLADAETAAAVDRALTQVWRRLEPEERCALVWKHRHGVPQRRIAALLKVHESRVSRWLDRGLAKLRGALSPLLADGATLDEHARVLGAGLSDHLARLDVVPLPSGGDEPPPTLRRETP